MASAYTWDELAALTLARQFPDVAGRDVAAVARTAARIGPIQSQTARSPFLGLAARLPGLTHETVTAAYESTALVRGSTIRGTVHTSTPAQHVLLDATTRVAQRGTWRRYLPLEHAEVEEVWAALEEYAASDWRSPDDLRDHLRTWLTAHDETPALAALDLEVGRYLAFGHGGLLRRPLGGSWSGQGAPGYRSAAAVLPPDPKAERPAPDDPLADLVGLHLACHGPASRHDVAWWSGLGLRQVDVLLDRLDVVRRPGPDGREYADLPEAPEPRSLPGVLLLPEFDALLCGYDPHARDRFVAPPHHAVLWAHANGQMRSPLLVDGRITGFWRAAGSARRRPLEVTWFAGTRRPRKAELAQPVAAVEAALGIEVTALTVSREAG